MSTALPSTPRPVEPPRVGRPPRVSREQILAAAASMSHDTLSVSAVARSLGTVPGTIYNYFENKDALLGAVLDRVLAEIDPPDTDDWAGYLTWTARTHFDLLVANPALLTMGRHVGHSVHAARFVNRHVELLADKGLDEHEIAAAWTVVEAATFLTATLEVHGTQGTVPHGLSPQATQVATREGRSVRRSLEDQVALIIDGLRTRIQARTHTLTSAGSSDSGAVSS